MTEKRFTHDWSNDFKREVVTDHHNSDYEMMEKQCCELLNKLSDENEQLKRELTKFKEWKKHIGDVKREELDRVFKMSIYEIAEAFEYYEERIKKLEEMLQEWSDEDESCGHCKHLQIDGMFGMWCDKGRNWQNTDANYCSDYER